MDADPRQRPQKGQINLNGDQFDGTGAVSYEGGASIEFEFSELPGTLVDGLSQEAVAELSEAPDSFEQKRLLVRYYASEGDFERMEMVVDEISISMASFAMRKFIREGLLPYRSLELMLVLKEEGWRHDTDEKIAEFCGCSVSTVERRRNKLRAMRAAT